MQKNKMEISILGCEYKGVSLWHQDEGFQHLLHEMVDKLGCLQCSYQNHILVCSKTGMAVFDSDGKLIELYNLRKDPLVNVVGTNYGNDLEFEMVLLFSKINE